MDNLFQIACIPYDWHITLIIIVSEHAAVSFRLEMVNDRWGSAFLFWIFRRQNRPPKRKYKCLALKQQDEADWPPAPSTTTYASTAQYHISVPF
ncbi:polyamine-transporting ATPase 13A3-like [Phyllopteryx taeniolatus]|uniref:polyamine-transporting ATPase 13A3-like n=1 Tax=Phyllopteryx taeniolatus TaxID=161469 RepID=UPI002AD2A7BE|nr:polyamine-transporting ATPase 13A3-like [Phyllopteryx taeniolatus]